MPETPEEAPIVALLDRLTPLAEDKVVSIARTLSQASVFDEVVREQISAMTLGQRYEEITEAFNSIREDAKRMVEQVEDGKIDTFERIGNVWMKVTRGDIASRFENIKGTYLEVAEDSADQIEREKTILNAYQDFRGAMKEAEILAFDVLQVAEGEWEAAKASLDEAMQAVASDGGAGSSQGAAAADVDADASSTGQKASSTRRSVGFKSAFVRAKTVEYTRERQRL